jgi:hypothetical protein
MDANGSPEESGRLTSAEAERILESLTSIGDNLDAIRESVAAMREGTFGGEADSSRPASLPRARASDLARLNDLLRGLFDDLQDLSTEIRDCHVLLQGVDRKLSSLVGLVQ